MLNFLEDHLSAHYSGIHLDNPSNTIGTQIKTTFSLVSNSYSWIDLITPCSVTQSDDLSACRERGFGGSCLIFDSPDVNLGVNVYADFDSSFYDQKTNRCYRLNTTDISKENQSFVDYSATSSITLEWENFRSGDASIAGYNIYRRIG